MQSDPSSSAARVAQFARQHVAGRDFTTSAEFPHALWRAIGEAGLFRIGLPEAHGGDGGSYASIAAGERALIEASGAAGIASLWGGHLTTARYYIAGFGSQAQQAALLPAIISGASTPGVAISEPKVGAHPKLLTTRATRQGDMWRLDGEKSYVTRGDIAGLFLVLAITAMAGERKRYSFFIVPRDTPGLEVIEAPTSAAMRPVGHCALRLTACLVSAEALLGAADTAYEKMALPFRDAEDAIGTSGMAGKFTVMLRLLGDELGPTPPEAAIAELGALAGLAALAGPAAASLAAALDAEQLEAPEPQALLIGLRQLASNFASRITALRDGHAMNRGSALDMRLAGIETSLSVARGPRAIRMARVGQGVLADAAMRVGQG